MFGYINRHPESGPLQKVKLTKYILKYFKTTTVVINSVYYIRFFVVNLDEVWFTFDEKFT